MTSILGQILWLYMYGVLLAIVSISIYGVVVRPHILKKIIALTILADTANTFMIFIGYRLGATVPPILTTLNPSPSDIATFVSSAVDPVPQCLVITAIVINMAVTALLIFLSIQAYRLYRTLHVKELSRLRG
ncbi:MAG: Na+/H+ antiporter subunit C [Thermoprotei archaeon]|nr:MAG: Na+/H+ antiporter subunit C [Thermoprotei archaeon]